MKKAEWQAVYAPQGDALERRVRTTLDGFGGQARARIPKTGGFRRGGAGFGGSLRRPPWRPG